MDNLTIIQHNVNTWTNKKESLSSIYKRINPDIILINDHSLTNNTPLKIYNYATYSSHKDNSWHRGTAIAIRNTLQHTVIDDFETDLLAIKLETSLGPVTIATDYIPPSRDYFHFPDYTKLLNTPHPVYILGDLNARHPTLGYSTNTNTAGKAIQMCLDRNKLKHLGPHFPTYISQHSSTSPDIVLSNYNTYHNIHLSPGPVTTSDHIPIIAKISLSPIQIPIRPRPHLSKADWPKIKQDLEKITVPTKQNPTKADIDNYIQQWNAGITKAMEKHTPLLKHRVVPGSFQNHEIRTLHSQLDATYNHIVTSGPSPELHQQLTHLKHQLKTKYQETAQETWDEIVQNIDTERDPSKFFKSIKRFQGNNKQKAPYLQKDNGDKFKKPEEKEVLFRDHWKNIFRNDQDDAEFDQTNIQHVDTTINNNLHEITPYLTGDLNRLDNTFPPITLPELKLIIKNQKQKAPGRTGITATHLKKLPTNMLTFLLYIFNMSLSMGYFPDSYKHAIMIFIPKGSGSQHKVQNYRPISLLETQGKLLDKLINRRLIHYLELNNYTDDHQHGFRTGRGTHTALAEFYETLVNKRHVKNSNTDVVLRDVSKAFDKVWHNGLKYKLIQINLHTCFLRILCNFLDDRTASIRIDNYIGPPFPLLSGVPQGAGVSPTFYSFYIHDMPPPAPDSTYIAYADDITQIISYKGSYRMLAKKTTKAIKTINDFEKKWKIKTNTNKFTIIPMYRENKANITIDNNTLDYKTSGTILGLKINTRGIIPQVSNRKQKATSSLTQLFRFKNLSQRNKLKLYKSLVLSSLIYPTVPLNTLSKSQFGNLQTVQNRGLRLATNTSLRDRVTARSLHERLNILPVNLTIHKQAKNTWDYMKQSLPQKYETICAETPFSQRFKSLPSSRLKAEGLTPIPIYVKNSRNTAHTTPDTED